ncbi:hypothetical protein DFJ74DRAFT_472172 [Hyaloraphidium curvatum]|nr:hypothetical protein DFJ74DRAFT_472172 [Hyaloraphidium curvatum]
MDGDPPVETLLREAKGQYAVGKRKDAYHVYIRALESIVKELRDPLITGDDRDTPTRREVALRAMSTARTCLDEAGQILRSLPPPGIAPPAPPFASRSAPLPAPPSNAPPLAPLKPPRLPVAAESSAEVSAGPGSEDGTPPSSSITGTPPAYYDANQSTEKPKPKPPLPPKPQGASTWTAPLPMPMPLSGDGGTPGPGSAPPPSVSSPLPNATPLMPPALPARAIAKIQTTEILSKDLDAPAVSGGPPPQPPRPTLLGGRPPVPPPIVATPSATVSWSSSVGAIGSSSESFGEAGSDSSLTEHRAPSSASPTPTSSRPRSVPGRLEGNLKSDVSPGPMRPASSYSTQQQKKPGVPKSSLVKWHSDLVQQLDRVSADLKQVQLGRGRRHSDSDFSEGAKTAVGDVQSAYVAGNGDQTTLSSSNYLFNSSSPDPDNVNHLKGLKATLEVRAGRVLYLIDLARRTSLLQLKPHHLAHQLTITEQLLFLQIKPQDLLNHHPPQNPNPAIQASTDFFNYIARIVEHSILSEPTLTNRARAIHQWAKVSSHLLQIRNVQTLRAVSAAMRTPPVVRLKKTWAVVPKKSMNSIEAIRSLLSEQNNYYVYREWCARGGGINISDILGSAPTSISSSHSHGSALRLPRPAVPFFGIFIHDTYYLLAAMKKEGVVGPSGTLDNETVLKDKRVQDIVEQIVYYQSGGTYAPVSGGKGDLAMGSGSRESSRDSLHFREGGTLGVLKGIGSATANLARRSTKSSGVGATDGPATAGAPNLPPTIVSGSVDEQLKEMDDETMSLFTQHWILSRDWYTEKEVDDLSVQREPKVEEDVPSHSYSGPTVVHVAERAASSAISMSSTSTGVTLVERDSNRDSVASNYHAFRDSTASDVSFSEIVDAAAGASQGAKKSWSLKKMIGGFSISGRPDSIASDAIAEHQGPEEERRDEKRKSGGDVVGEPSTAPAAFGTRPSSGASPTPRELMAQAGMQAKSLAGKRGMGSGSASGNVDGSSLEFSDSSILSSPFSSPGTSRPTSAISTPNNASLDDVEPPGPLPVRQRSSRSPDRDYSSSAGSTVSDLAPRPFSYFAPASGGAIASDAIVQSTVHRRTYSGGDSPVSAPPGKPPLGEDAPRDGGAHGSFSTLKAHQRTHSAGRMVAGIPPPAFGGQPQGPSQAEKSLARRSTAATVARMPPSPGKERPLSAASAAGPKGPVDPGNEAKRKAMKGVALPGMAAGPGGAPP